MSISITNNLTLRSFYSADRSLVDRNNRSNQKNSTLSFADATALRKAIRDLGDFDYEKISSAKDKKNLSSHLEAFLNTYNYAIASSSSSSDSDVAAAGKGLKQLTKKYADKLDSMGISMDSKGNLSLSKSATENIRSERFLDLFGEDSRYMQQMNTYAKRIVRHVNVYL